MPLCFCSTDRRCNSFSGLNSSKGRNRALDKAPVFHWVNMLSVAQLSPYCWLFTLKQLEMLCLPPSGTWVQRWMRHWSLPFRSSRFSGAIDRINNNTVHNVWLRYLKELGEPRASNDWLCPELLRHVSEAETKFQRSPWTKSQLFSSLRTSCTSDFSASGF